MFQVYSLENNKLAYFLPSPLLLCMSISGYSWVLWGPHRDEIPKVILGKIMDSDWACGKAHFRDYMMAIIAEYCYFFTLIISTDRYSISLEERVTAVCSANVKNILGWWIKSLEPIPSWTLNRQILLRLKGECYVFFFPVSKLSFLEKIVFLKK